MLHRSPNCSAYTDSVHLLVTGEAFVPGEEDRCKISVPAHVSCQRDTFETADAATQDSIRAKAALLLEEKGCSTSAFELALETILVGARDVEYSAKDMLDHGMASNCFRAGNDINDAPHVVTAACTNQFDMTDLQGKRVRNTNMRFTSTLRTCDVSESAWPQLQEDGRKVAAHLAAQNGLRPDKDTDLSCTFSVLPTY
jgi:hypothetical protein